jgi:hypothetical protein
VPHDVPIRPRVIQASLRRGTEANLAELSDFTPADFETGVTPAVEEKPQGKAESAPVPTVAVVEGGDIPVPNFGGKTMREVTEECLRLGLDPVLVGTGLAAEQVPEAGSRVRRGGKVTVRFGRPAGKRRSGAGS